jgi:hypothetical protein
MLFTAAGQHTRDPEPKSAPHHSKPKHTRKGSSHENARGPTLLAGRALPEARGRAKALSLSLPAHWACLRGGPRPWAQASPAPPSPAATRAREHACAHSRLTSVTVVFFWSAAARAVAPAAPMLLPAAGQHTRDPEPKSAPHDSKAEARAQGNARERKGPDAAGRASAARGARPRKGSLSLPTQWERLRGGPRPWAHASPNPLHPPQPPEHARALWRLTAVTVVFSWSAAARAVAPAAPMSFPAAGKHTRDPEPPEHARALLRLTVVTVVFFCSAAARAVAPASPMLLTAAGQHTRDPEPKSAPHDSKPKHARKGSSHENARGPSTLAGRAQPKARGRAKALSLPPRTLGAPARRAAAVGPSVPQPPSSPTTTRARSRTCEVDRRDRRVLLERGRQSCRAGGADVVGCGGAAHPRPRAQVSATPFQAEARAQGALTRNRAGQDAAGRASAARGTRPRKGPLSLPPRTLGAPARRAAAVGLSVPQPPPSPATTRARSRTSEAERCERRVLLERGRQSCRAGGADVVVCGGAAHPRPRAQVSTTQFQAEARAQGKLARERAGPEHAGRASAARGARPCKGTLSPSPHIRRACAAGRGRGPKRPPTPFIPHDHQSTLAHMRGRPS